MLKHPFNRDTKTSKKKHPLYYRWHNLIVALTKETHKNYNLYGGKGIKMCSEWKSNYLNFLIWATKNGYHKDLVLSRKDKDKDFDPSNCFWAEHCYATEPT